MKHTSLGIHTLAFFQRLTNDHYFSLMGIFNTLDGMNREPIKDNRDNIIGWEYTYKSPKGIRWRLISIEVNHQLTIYGITAIITPKVLIDKDYINVARASDIEIVETLFNQETERISPIIKSFGLCSINRSDPGLTFDVRELNLPCSPKQLITLGKRGNIPKGFTERMEYDKKQKRKISDPYSLYIGNGSIGVNYYWKFPKIGPKHPDYHNREEYRYVMRFETQPKYRKLYSISKRIKHNSRFYIPTENMTAEELWEMVENDIRNPSVPVDVMTSNMMSAELVQKYFDKVIGKGNYVTLDCAEWMVQVHNFRRDKEERLLWTLNLIFDSRGITKARSKLLGDDLRDFKRSIDDLNDMYINPVTIPEAWGIDHISNPLRAYYDSITDEQIISHSESLFNKLLAEYLSK